MTQFGRICIVGAVVGVASYAVVLVLVRGGTPAPPSYVYERSGGPPASDPRRLPSEAEAASSAPVHRVPVVHPRPEPDDAPKDSDKDGLAPGSWTDEIPDGYRVTSVQAAALREFSRLPMRDELQMEIDCSAFPCIVEVSGFVDFDMGAARALQNAINEGLGESVYAGGLHHMSVVLHDEPSLSIAAIAMAPERYDSPEFRHALDTRLDAVVAERVKDVETPAE